MTDLRPSLKPADVAAVLAITTEQSLHLIHTGRIRAVNVSPPGSKRPRYRVPADALDDFLRGVQPQQSKPARRPRAKLRTRFYT